MAQSQKDVRVTSSKANSETSSHSVTSTSRSLLQRLRDDDSEAWNRLIKLYAPLVYYWCRKQQVPEQDIPDVVQDVFKAVMTNIGKFRKEKSQDTFRGWLRTITRSKSVDHFRRQKDRPKAAGGTETQLHFSQVADGTLDEEEDDEQAENALFLRAVEIVRQDFQQQTFQAFWLTVVEGQAPKDAAEELGMSAGAVRVAKSRVLNRLRQELGELLD